MKKVRLSVCQKVMVKGYPGGYINQDHGLEVLPFVVRLTWTLGLEDGALEIPKRSLNLSSCI